MTGATPSSTALLIAWSMRFLSEDPALAGRVPVLTRESAAWFLQAARWRVPYGRRWLHSPAFRTLVTWVEHACIPGVMLHYLLRKQLLEQHAHQALREGYTQMVVFGAGFDTLALRLSRDRPDLRIVEVDHPATQRLKRDVLVARNLLPKNLQLVPLDLARPNALARLSGSGLLEQARETLFVAEGVLMYLDAPAVDELLDFCRSVGSKPRIAFTFMERLEDGRIAFRNQSRVVDGWLRRRGEPFRWGLPCGELPEYLLRQGFAADSIATTNVLRERYLRTAALAGRALADGDHVCLAVSGPAPVR